MSVINKMLRDLDARRGDARVPDLPQAVIPAAMHGTASVAALASRPVLRWGLGLALLLLFLAALAWYLHATQPVTPPPVAINTPAPVVQPAEAVPLPVTPALETVTSAAEIPPGPAALATPEPAAQPETPAAAPRKKRRSKEAVVVEASPSALTSSRPRAPVEAAVPAPVPVPPLVAAPTESMALAATQRRQVAAQEAQAQAQILWNSGSREAALELVRGAVTAVERAQPPDAGLLAQLVREQVRMELALGRPGAVLAVLTRLESWLSGQADLWAVRGNAAQRLGRHQESVQAYLAALQLRPEEPRWMLGAAVSLAALGQLEAAARQAEQARALGPVSPDVLSYLRQAGVPLR